MPKKTPKDEAKTKDRILSAATDEFVEQGYHGARMQKIADRAGVNKALLHYYYKSKENIYVTVLATIFESLAGKLSAIDAGSGEVGEKIEEIIDAYISLFMEQGKYVRLVLYEIIRGGDKLAGIAAANLHRVPLNPFSGKLYAYFKKAAREKKIRHISPIHIFLSAISQIAPVIFAKEMLGRHAGVLGIDRLLLDRFIKERKKVVMEIMMDGIRKK